MRIEQAQGEQFDPAEIAIRELQGPTDPDHEATIRRAFWERTPMPKSVVGLNNPDFPEVSGRTRSGIDGADLAEELQYAGVEPVFVDAPVIEAFGPADPDLEEGSGWE